MKQRNDFTGIKKYIENHENNPLYLACKATLDGHDIDINLSDKLIKSIFNINNLKNNNFNLHFSEMVDFKLPFGAVRSYQQNIKDIPNDLILKHLFSDLNKTENKNDFNIYKSMGLYLEKDKFYSELQNGNNTMAYTYKTFIEKMKNAIYDEYSLPYPYNLSSNKGAGLEISKFLNLNLLKNISSIFKYPNLKDGSTVLSAFSDDIKAVFNDSLSDKKYQNDLSLNLFKIHPNYYANLGEHYNMPRNIAISYLTYNASTIEPEKFPYFASSFKSLFIDVDFIYDMALQNNKNPNEKFIKNMENINIYNQKNNRDVYVTKYN